MGVVAAAVAMVVAAVVASAVAAKVVAKAAIATIVVSPATCLVSARSLGKAKAVAKVEAAKVVVKFAGSSRQAIAAMGTIAGSATSSFPRWSDHMSRNSQIDELSLLLHQFGIGLPVGHLLA